MRKAETKAVSAMLIFGSIGLFVRLIPLASSEVAFYRAVLGSLFLLAAGSRGNASFSFGGFRQNKFPLLLTGSALGLNWVFLFEAYRYTTLANATISYYMAPVLVMLFSPFILNEKRTIQKTVCAFLALFGLIIMTGSVSYTTLGAGSLTGIFFGLLAAVFYAAVMIGNKFFNGLSTRETTLGQLIVAAVVLTPYVFWQEGFHVLEIGFRPLVLLLIVGIVHTGIAYLFYFSALQEASVQNIALISYLDPISAVAFSFVFLKEPLTLMQILGGLLVLGGAFFGEINLKKRKRDMNT